MNATTSKPTSFLRALVLLAVIVVGVPWFLTWAANQRFGGPAPWSAMPPVGEWSASTIGEALTDRLSEATVADIVIRIALAVVWVAIIVLLVTVVAEMAHMVRHAGIALPSMRGLGPTQDLARVIAAGLLVVVPMLSSSSTAIADDSPLRLPEGRAPAAAAARPDNARIGDAAPGPGPGTPTVDAGPDVPAVDSVPTGAGAAESYTVRPGDSVYGIAERLAGPDPVAVSALANGILDLNLGQRMVDGQLFSNAAYIDVGWVLQLPPEVAAAAAVSVPPGAMSEHVVEEGETLWSIADDELGDASRWPEIYEANQGRTFSDGRQLSDPDVIQPGWHLDVPAAGHSDEPDAAGGEGSDDPTIADAGASAPDDAGVFDDADERAPEAHRDNAWVTTAGGSSMTADRTLDEVASDPPPERAGPAAPTDPPATTAAPTAESSAGMPAVAAADHETTDGTGDEPGHPGDADIELLTFERAAMLSAGVLTLLGVRRRRRMREAASNSRLPDPKPELVRVERALRTIDAGERFARVDIAVRAAAMPLVEHGARVLAAAVGPDGDVELWASAGCDLAAPWNPGADRTRWLLPASTPIELLAPDARRVGAPCPTLIQLGTCDDGRDLYVDLEALEAVEVGGPGAAADAIVAAAAATLSASVLAEVTTLVGVGVADDAFLGHRLHRPARSVQDAFATAAEAVGSTAHADRTTFDLRARVTSGEMWEPAVVLVGAAAGTVTPPQNRTGLAVVSASPILGPSSRLAPENGSWVLRPLDIRLTPIGVSADDVAALAAVVDVDEPEASIELDDDRTMAPVDVDELGLDSDDSPWDRDSSDDDGEPPTDAPSLEYALVVRLLGPVSVESADGRSIEFERSKTKELIAWLATHRDRSTRSNARAALWELDVRDNTFSNVVSEARRAMARCVEPPEGEEWLARTMTDALPLHPLVVSDVDLVEHALDTARLQPPAQAIVTLRGALDWIRSVPFEGTSYLWPDAEGITSALVLRAITLTSALADHCLSVGDVDGVFEATSRGLQVLPAHEEMIAVRMRAYAKVGDRAGVRHEWESYERAITADPWSDGEPSPKMLDLRRDLL